MFTGAEPFALVSATDVALTVTGFVAGMLLGAV
jgi:hypothetical protein